MFSYDSPIFLRFLWKFNESVIDGKNVGGENNRVTFMLLCCQLCWCNLWQKPLLNINGYLKFTVDIDGISEPFDSKSIFEMDRIFLILIILKYFVFPFWQMRWGVSSLFGVLHNLNFVVSGVPLSQTAYNSLHISNYFTEDKKHAI